VGFYSRPSRPGPHHRRHWIRRTELQWAPHGSLEGGRLPGGNRRGSFFESSFYIVGVVGFWYFVEVDCVPCFFFVFLDSLGGEGGGNGRVWLVFLMDGGR